MLLLLAIMSARAKAFGAPLPEGAAPALAAMLTVIAACIALFAWNTIQSLTGGETKLERMYRRQMGFAARPESFEAFWGASPLKWIVPHAPDVNGLVWAHAVMLNSA